MTPEEFITRGKGEYVNCTDYDDAITAMKKYAAEKDKEIERLRGLVETQFKAANGWDMESMEGGYAVFQSTELQEKEWQQFKKENNL